MYRLLFLIVLMFLGLSGLNSQASNSLSPAVYDFIRGDVEFSVDEYLEVVGERLNLSNGSSFELKKQWVDYIGHEHHRMYQTYRDIEVAGAMFIIHSQNKVVRSANGHLIRGRFVSSIPVIEKEAAWDKIEKAYEAYQFYHENEDMEDWLKSQRGDEEATFFPEGELVYVDPSYGARAEDYRLAWKFDIFVQKEIDHEWVYVDAHMGDIIYTRAMTTSGCFEHEHGQHGNCGVGHEGCHGAIKEEVMMVDPRGGLGYTFYNGIKEFITDSVGSDRYRLFDNTRGNGIHTLNANNRVDTFFATEFIDEENFWDLRNMNKNEAAIDAHWAASQTFDFWKNEYNYTSFDNAGARMTSFVHWDFGWFNAVWNGLYARFGDGTGNPLTYIDITAHEFTHGLTGNSSALIYAYESGALNESFSDIFGTAVEFTALGDTAPWSLGIPVSPFRDMSNPNRRNHPDTYEGRFWSRGTADNGGVHTNSGVQNYWYYLLCEGGSGVNDNGESYTVDSIGMKKASAIAFRNLTTYLVPSSNYEEARFGSLLSAIDLYGECSPEALAVSDAWAAVGIGSPLDSSHIFQDIQVIQVDIEAGACREEGSSLGVEFRHNISGCNQNIEPGSVIRLGYRVNDQQAIIEELILSEDLSEGDIINYKFSELPIFEKDEQNEIDVWVNLESDGYARNDTASSLSFKIPIVYESSPAIMIFRRPNFSADTFFLETNENSSAGISVQARNSAYSDLFGFEMTGSRASLRSLNIPFSESQNFTLNPNFGAKLCFCVDANRWNSVFVAFDRKQTYSEVYSRFMGRNIPELVSSMRVLLNDEQIGNQYHPTTFKNDPWVRDTINISQVSGTLFEFCFEGKHFIDRSIDNSINGITSNGDYTYLDNIVFFDPDAVSNRDLVDLPVTVHPNPGVDEVVVWMAPDDLREMSTISVTNQLGENVIHRDIEDNGDESLRLNTEMLAPGVYYIRLEGQGHFAVTKWVKH